VVRVCGASAYATAAAAAGTGEPLDDGRRKLSGADAAADGGLQFGGREAVLDGPQPGIVDPGGDGGLPDVDQHHDGGKQQPRGIGDALARDVRRAAWIASNMATCSPMLALPARPTEPVISAAMSDRMSP